MTGIAVSRNGLDALEKLQAENERLREAERERLYDPCGHCACTEICEDKNKELRAENGRLKLALGEIVGLGIDSQDITGSEKAYHMKAIARKALGVRE
jgi:hypothetical protein